MAPPLARSRPRSSFAAGRWRPFAFVALSSVVVVAASERMYWYPADHRPLEMAGTLATYALAVSAMLWVVDRYSVRTARQMAAASLAYALVTEGIITPVIYGDGPLPVLAVYFAGWHSGLAVLFLWCSVRRWALQSRRARLAWSALAIGVAWGLWSTVYWRDSTIADMRREVAAGEAGWDAGQWPTGKFALHAFAVTSAVILAHRLLGSVWPERFALTRRWVRLVSVLLVLGLGVMTVAVFFAPLKLAVLAWVVARLVRARRSEETGPGLLAQLAGPVQLADLAPLTLMPVAAVATYAAMAAADPSDTTLGVVYGVGVAVTLAAGVLVVWSAGRARRGAAEAVAS